MKNPIKTIINSLFIFFTLSFVCFRPFIDSPQMEWATSICLITFWFVSLFKLIRHTYNIKVMVIIICLVTIISVVLVTPYSATQPQSTTINIVATGEQNEASGSNEVWITHITVDGEDLDLSDYLADGWVIKELGELFTNNGVISLKLQQYTELDIYFITHPWSGIVSILSPSGETQLDLYNPIAQQTNISVPFKASRNSLHQTVLYYIFLLSVSCSIAFSGIKLYYKPNRLIVSSYIMRLSRKALYIAIGLLTLFLVGIVFLNYKSISFHTKVLAYFEVMLFISYALWVLHIHKSVLLSEQIKGVIWKSLMYAVILVFSVIPLLNMLFARSDIQLIVTGDANPKSLSSAIGLSSIIVDGKSKDLSDYKSESWYRPEFDDFVGTEAGSVFRIILPKYNSLQIGFDSHVYSGVVKIINNNDGDIIDLYSDLYNIQYSNPIPFYASLRISSVLLYSLLLFILSHVIIYTFLSRLPSSFSFHKYYAYFLVVLSFLSFHASFTIRLGFFTTWGIIVLFAHIIPIAYAVVLLFERMFFKMHQFLFAMLCAIIIMTINTGYFQIVKETPCSVSIIYSESKSVSPQNMCISRIRYGSYEYSYTDINTTGWVVEDNELKTNIVENRISILLPSSEQILVDLYFDGLGGVATLQYNDWRLPSKINEIVKEQDSSIAEKVTFSFRTPDSEPDNLKTLLLRIIMFAHIVILFHFIILNVWMYIYLKGKNTSLTYRKQSVSLNNDHMIVLLTPVLFVFYLFNQNQSYLDYLQVIILCLFLCLFSFFIYFMLERFCFTSLVSSCITSIWWLYFFTFNSSYTYFWMSGIKSIYFTITFFLFIMILPILQLFFSKINNPKINALIASTIAIVFLFSFIPTTYQYILNTNKASIDYKSDFIIDRSLPKPNIYWFHMDGMMGFSSVERVFSDSQDEFRGALVERSFKINEDAYFESITSTALALPSLLSPQYYSDVGWSYFTRNEISTVTTLQDYWKVLDKSFSTFESDLLQVRLNYEIFKALNDAGYYTNLIFSNVGTYFGSTMSRRYDISKNPPRVISPIPGVNSYQVIQITEKLYSLNDLLGQTSLTTFIQSKIDNSIDKLDKAFWQQYPLDIDDRTLALTGTHAIGRHINMVASLLDSINTPSPHFVFMYYDVTHSPFRYNELGEIVNTTREAYYNMISYMPTHRYAARVLLGMIDYILLSDPDAVIVIQADHGVHIAAGADQMLNDWGFTFQQVRDVANGVMSAVRIPEKYDGIDKPIDPLNITRELINRFAGPNYDLLPPDQPNQRKPELTESDWANWSYENIINQNK